MASDVTLRTFDNGAMIIREGTRGEEMYSVVSGKVRIYREGKGTETTLGIVHPGEVFGEMALFDDEPRAASAVAVGPAEIRVISRAEFERLECAPLMRQVLTQMARRLRSMNTSYEKLSLEDQQRRDYMHAIPMRRDWVL